MFQATGLCRNTYYACLWRSQNWDGTSATVNCKRGMDPFGCRDGWHRWQETHVDGPWSATGGWYHSDIKLWPSPLKHKEVVLLLSCWKRWDHGSIPGSAINTWLKNVNVAIGPDCEDSPHFRRTGMDDLEAMRLLVESGFDFLTETELQKRPCMDMVMSVGLQLCALEFTDRTPWLILL